MKNSMHNPVAISGITKTAIGMAFAFGILVISCKQVTSESSAEENGTETKSEVENVASSSAAVENKNSNRKFVRTADIKFEVKNVPKSTYAIENAVVKFGGFVTYTNLQSTISEKNTTKISQDSVLETTKYKVDNNITIRVPNTKLDTVIKMIASQIGFLDYRVIKADDVSSQLLANQLAQNRSAEKEQRVAKAIDLKGKKLTDITVAEEQLANQKTANDELQLQNLAIADKVKFSTLTLQIYQRETVKNEIVASEINVNAYRPHLGLQILDGLKTGWYLLEGIIGFVVQLWSLILLGLIGFILYRKYLKKSAPQKG